MCRAQAGLELVILLLWSHNAVNTALFQRAGLLVLPNLSRLAARVWVREERERWEGAGGNPVER